MADGNTETLVYLVDLQFPGIEEKTTQVRGLRTELDQFPSKAKGAADGAKDLGDKSKEAAAGAKEFKEGLASGREALTSWTEEARKLGVQFPVMSQGIQGASVLMTGFSTGALGTITVVGGLVVAISSATAALTAMGAEWQHTLTNLAAAGDMTQEQAHQIGSAFQQLAQEVPASASELTEAYTAVVGRLQLYTGETLTAAQATEFMRTASEGAVATNQSLASTSNALAQQIMASHSTLEDQTHVMDVLTNVTIATGASMDQVTLIAGRLQARMGASAPPIEGVATALALAASAGLTGQRAIIPLMTALENLANPSETAKRNLESLHIEVVKNANGSLDLAETLVSLKTAYDALATPEQKHALLEELVGQNAGILEAILKKSNEQIHRTAEEMDRSGTAHEKAEIHATDLRERLEKLANQAGATAQNIGGVLAAAVVGLGDDLDRTGQTAQKVWEILQRTPTGFALNALGARGTSMSREQYYSQFGFDAEHAQAGVVGPLLSQVTSAETGTRADPAAIRATASATFELGQAGEQLQKSMEDAGKTGLAVDLEKINKQSMEIQQTWQKLFDPDAPEKTAERIAELSTLTDGWTRAVVAGNTEEAKAAASAIDNLNRQATEEERRLRQKQVGDQYALGVRERERAQDAEQRRSQQEQRDFATRYGTGAELGGRALENLERETDMRGRQFQAQQELTSATQEHEDAVEGVRRGWEDTDVALKQVRQDTDELTKETREDSDYTRQIGREDARDRLRMVREDSDYTRSLGREDSDYKRGLGREDADYSKSLNREVADDQLALTRHVTDEVRGYSRSDRDERINTQRELTRMDEEHRRRLQEIQAQGGSGASAAIDRENASYKQRLADLQEQQRFRTEDTQRHRSDQAQDDAQAVSRQQEDRGRQHGRHDEDLALTRDRHDVDTVLMRSRHSEDLVLTRQRHAEDVALTRSEHADDLGMIRERYVLDRDLARDRATEDTATTRAHSDEQKADTRAFALEMTQGAGGLRDAIEHLYGIAPDQVAEANAQRERQQAFADLQVRLSDQYATNMERAATASERARLDWEKSVGEFLGAGGSLEEFTNRYGASPGGGASLPHYATGGSFVVGGSGATDSQLVKFMASPGEIVGIHPAPALHDVYAGTRTGPGGGPAPGMHDYASGTAYNQDYMPQLLPPSVRFGGAPAATTSGGSVSGAGSGAEATIRVENHFDLTGAVISDDESIDKLVAKINVIMTKQARATVPIGGRMTR